MSDQFRNQGFLLSRLNCDDSLNIMREVKGNFTTDFQNRTHQKKVHVLKEILKEIIEKKTRMKEIFQILLIPIFIKMTKTNFEDTCNTLCLLIHVRVFKKRVIRKTVCGVSNQVIHKSDCSTIEYD